MALNEAEIQEIVSDPARIRDFVTQYQATADKSSELITDLQNILTALGLYANHPHKYHADGIDGPVTQHGIQLALGLYGDEDAAPQDSSYTASIIEDTQRLISDPNLTPAETMRLQQNLHYLERIDSMDSGQDFALNPGNVDGIMGPKTSSAALAFAEKYGLEIYNRSEVARQLRRDGVDLRSRPEIFGDNAPGTDAEGRYTGEVRPLNEILSATVMTGSRIADLQESLSAAGFDVGPLDGMVGSKTINGSDGNSGLMAALKADPSLLTSMSQSALSTVWRHASIGNREWIENTWNETFPSGDRAAWLEAAKIPSGGRFLEGIDSSDVNTMTLLNFIGHYEARGNYNIAFDGTADGRAVPATTMTFAQINAWRSEHLAELRSRGIWPSSALGKYQGVGDTLDGFLRANPDIDPNTDLFDEAMQDRFGIYLLHERGLARFLSGEKDADWFAQQLAKEWASLPAGSDNLSHYGGDGFHNDARVSWNDTLALLNDFRENYLAQQASPDASVELASVNP